MSDARPRGSAIRVGRDVRPCRHVDPAISRRPRPRRPARARSRTRTRAAAREARQPAAQAHAASSAPNSTTNSSRRYVNCTNLNGPGEIGPEVRRRPRHVERRSGTARAARRAVGQLRRPRAQQRRPSIASATPPRTRQPICNPSGGLTGSGSFDRSGRRAARTVVETGAGPSVNGTSVRSVIISLSSTASCGTTYQRIIPVCSTPAETSRRDARPACADGGLDQRCEHEVKAAERRAVEVADVVAQPDQRPRDGAEDDVADAPAARD